MHRDEEEKRRVFYLYTIIKIGGYLCGTKKLRHTYILSCELFFYLCTIPSVFRPIPPLDRTDTWARTHYFLALTLFLHQNGGEQARCSAHRSAWPAADRRRLARRARTARRPEGPARTPTAAAGGGGGARTHARTSSFHGASSRAATSARSSRASLRCSSVVPSPGRPGGVGGRLTRRRREVGVTDEELQLEMHQHRRPLPLPPWRPRPCSGSAPPFTHDLGIYIYF